MKSLRYQGLLIAVCLVSVACNKAEEDFFAKESVVMGIDAQCSAVPDEAACLESPGCQPAYNEPLEGQEKGEYAACILNPDSEVDGGASGGEESSGGSASGGEETSGGSVSGGEETSGGSSSGGEVTSGGSSSGGEETSGSASGGSTSGSVSSGSTSGSVSAGSSSGSSGSSSSGSSSGGSSDDDIDEESKGQCKGIDSEHLYIVKEIVNKKGDSKVIAKAKVCHNSAKSSHTIIIACPAVKAHVKNHGDKLGACEAAE